MITFTSPQTVETNRQFRIPRLILIYNKMMLNSCRDKKFVTHKVKQGGGCFSPFDADLRLIYVQQYIKQQFASDPKHIQNCV